MRIRNLRLENVCQHELLDWKFERGLVGVFGPNGSGKSNALNVACYSGITNDYSRHPGGKPGMIRQQAGEDGKSEIRIVFEHDGHDVELIRGLQKPVKHRLILDGGQEIKKAGDIQEMVEDTLGISRRLIDQYMFVGQDDLYAFLSDTPAVRAKSFAYLCNTTHAERCWEVLGEFIERDRDLALQIVDNTDEIRSEIGELIKKLRAAEKKLAEAAESLLLADDVEEHEETVNAWSELTRLEQELPGLLRKEDELLKAATAKNTRRKQTGEAVPLVEAEVEELEAKASEAASQLREYAAAKKAWQAKVSAQRRVSEARKVIKGLPKKPEEPDTERPEKLHIEHADLAMSIKSAEKLLKQFEEGVIECPTCGTPVSDFIENIDETREALNNNYLPRREEIQEILRQWSDYAHEITSWERQEQKCQQELSTAEELLGSHMDAEKPEEIDQEGLLLARESYADRKQRLAELRQEYTAATGAFQQAKGLHQAAKERKEECEEQIDLLANTVDGPTYNEAKDALASHRAAEIEHGKAQSAVDNLEEFVEDRRAELKRIQAQLKRSQAARRWLRDLADVRDNVMHRDKLPAVVHHNAIANMEDEINANLEYFDSPYFVVADANLGFTAKFANGTVMPAEGLSGGQKVMLALAFRLAVNSLFAAQVGMMILDEPTDGLDADNRRLAGDVFRSLGQIAKDRGHQVIVITHDEALQPAFDQRFVLEKAV